MNAKLKQIPTIGAAVFGFWAALYAAATVPEAEIMPLLVLFGAGTVCAFVAAAIRLGGER